VRIVVPTQTSFSFYLDFLDFLLSCYRTAHLRGADTAFSPLKQFGLGGIWKEGTMDLLRSGRLAALLLVLPGAGWLPSFVQQGAD
jgi:hypothetical protein